MIIKKKINRKKLGGKSKRRTIRGRTKRKSRGRTKRKSRGRTKRRSRKKILGGGQMTLKDVLERQQKVQAAIRSQYMSQAAQERRNAVLRTQMSQAAQERRNAVLRTQMTLQDVLERQQKVQAAIRLHRRRQAAAQERERRNAVLRRQIVQERFGIEQPEWEPTPRGFR